MKKKKELSEIIRKRMKRIDVWIDIFKESIST